MPFLAEKAEKAWLDSWIGDKRSYISVGIRISDRDIIRMLDVEYEFSYEQESENENLDHILRWILKMNGLEIRSTLFKLYILNRPFTGLCYQA